MNAPLRIVSAGGNLDRIDCPQLGRLLIDRGVLGWPALVRALEAQANSNRRLGEVLVAQGAVSALDVAEALAEQWGLQAVDLDREPLDPALIDPDDTNAYLAHGILPWRMIGGVTAFVLSSPEDAQAALASLSRAPQAAFILIAPQVQVERETARALGDTLAARAATLAPEGQSVRSVTPARRAAALVLLGAFAALGVGGPVAIAAGLLFLFVLNACTAGLRIAALIASRRSETQKTTGDGAIDFVGKRAPPVVSLLVPLFREGAMIGSLVGALGRLEYPRDLLDVLLLVEEDDAETRQAISTANLPPWIRPLIVPKGAPRTKPRALNFALDFCRGEIVGILDAEDHPAPGQITEVVEMIRKAPPEVACVQCQLGYFNARENWLSRCFQLEYAIWFDVLLRGFQWLRLPIPLGGTSVYFRRSALRELGGWDAHNVTEDADLGMRLARAGMRCAVSKSVTMEEANCIAWPWIRQRSRWLKGYLLTWLSHMRDPVRLWCDLGPGGFFGLNVLFLGSAATYLAAPLFWVAVIGWLVSGETAWSAAIPGWAIWPAAVSLVVGQITMLSCAVLAMKRRGMPDLILWVPGLPVYWTLGAIAAWKAVFELIVAPYYWDKTRHGISRMKASV
ncbi:glycosyltransferase [Rhodobacteraceae bacterium NNCM2]|nr:glycosyltransferase [Coraliihabitans acroporae]